MNSMQETLTEARIFNMQALAFIFYSTIPQNRCDFSLAMVEYIICLLKAA